MRDLVILFVHFIVTLALQIGAAFVPSLPNPSWSSTNW